MSQVADRVAAKLRESAAATAAQAPAARGAVNFQDSFRLALSQVSGAQNEVAALQREVQLGNPTVSLEQTMVAMQKAQIGFQAALTVRNKLVQAYSDVMNMQV
ncbi:flagellar hook-basal body complex protein FliE [Aquariibacter albus]